MSDIDVWVREQLGGFAPLGPADLAELAGILGYEVPQDKEGTR